jgi:hypothetical protein
MCTDPAGGGVRAALPRPAPGPAADPITLEPADDVTVTTLVDNVYDALLTGDDTITRAPITAGIAQAPQFEPGRTTVGLMAEHGFSALVTVRRGDTTTSVLFDTGLSPDAMVTNAARLGLDLGGVHAVVLSHGTSTTPAAWPAWPPGADPGLCRWSCTRWPGPAAAWPGPAAGPRTGPPSANAPWPGRASR